MPIENGFEQVIEGFNGLRAQFVEDTANLNAVISMRMFAAFGRHQHSVIALTVGAESGLVVVGIAQDKANFSRQFRKQQRRNRRVISIGDRQLGRQRNPYRADRYGQMEFPAIPPAMPAGFAPSRFGINAAVGNLATLSMFFVPNSATGLECCAVHRRRASVLLKWLQGFNQISSQAAYQTWQGLRQRLQSALPGAPTGKPPIFHQQFAQALADAILLDE